MVLRQVLILAGAGLAIGIPLAMATTRVVRSVLFRVEPGDPLSILTAALVLLGIATASGLVPARRAARLDPVAALRQE